MNNFNIANAEVTVLEEVIEDREFSKILCLVEHSSGRREYVWWTHRRHTEEVFWGHYFSYESFARAYQSFYTNTIIFREKDQRFLREEGESDGKTETA